MDTNDNPKRENDPTIEFKLLLKSLSVGCFFAMLVGFSQTHIIGMMFSCIVVPVFYTTNTPKHRLVLCLLSMYLMTAILFVEAILELYARHHYEYAFRLALFFFGFISLCTCLGVLFSGLYQNTQNDI